MARISSCWTAFIWKTREPQASHNCVTQLAAAALVRGRPLWLAVVICLGAAFYPTVAVTGGITLAIVLLFWPVIDRAFGSVTRLLRPVKSPA